MKESYATYWSFHNTSTNDSLIAIPYNLLRLFHSNAKMNAQMLVVSISIPRVNNVDPNRLCLSWLWLVELSFYWGLYQRSESVATKIRTKIALKQKVDSPAWDWGCYRLLHWTGTGSPLGNRLSYRAILHWFLCIGTAVSNWNSTAWLLEIIIRGYYRYSSCTSSLVCLGLAALESHWNILAVMTFSENNDVGMFLC